jgi:CxxC motif-containing protein (DUF1111 family)
MSRRVITVAPACVLLSAAALFAQSDPGPQQGPPTAGRPLQGLTPQENGTFQEGQRRFRDVVSVRGNQPGAQRNGLGPRFNLNSCAGCHAQPVAGGSSPSSAARQTQTPNPQIAMASADGASNVIPPFIQSDGPVRVARFVLAADGTPDGNVYPLFVISGRRDAGGCNLAQPDFTSAVAQNNVVFRIPTPVFGAGLMEAIPDDAILANLAANPDLKASLGIAGRPNRTNDGTISRFGWKAQTRSLEQFSGEAYNVEMGVTNELYRSEKDAIAGCALNPMPEDQTDFASNSPTVGMSDVAAFAQFMRWLAPPMPPGGPQRGQQVFVQSGCNLCHTPMMTTGNTTSAALNNKPVFLYSDLALHHMGTGLADGVSQGLATGDEFRTAPLWGLGQRVYFLHDGRTSDLLAAIEAHASDGSEGSSAVAAFNALPQSAMQDLLNFLRSL